MEKLTKMKLVYIKVYGIDEYESLLQEICIFDRLDEDCLLQTVDLTCEALRPQARLICLEKATEFHMLMGMVEHTQTEAQVTRILYAP